MNTRFWLTLSTTALLAGGAGYGAGYFRGVGKGAEISAAMHDVNDARQAFSQAGLALRDLSQSPAGASAADRTQLLIALHTLGGIAQGGPPRAACTDAERETLRSIAQHLRQHPLQPDRPDMPLVRAALGYCG